MIDVYTDWCHWCKELDKNTYADAEVVKLSKEFVPLKLNPEKDEQNAQIARKYRIEGYPTIIFVSSDGDMVHRLEGYLEPKPFLAEMQKALEDEKKLQKFKETLKSKADDIEANAEAALIYLRRVNLEMAQPLLEKSFKLDPKNEKGYLPKLYLSLAMTLGLREQYKEALENLDKLLNNYPKFENLAQGYYYKGIIHAILGNIPQATEALKKCIEMAKDPQLKEQAEEVLSQIK